MTRMTRVRWVLQSPRLHCPHCDGLIKMEFGGSWKVVIPPSDK